MTTKIVATLHPRLDPLEIDDIYSTLNRQPATNKVIYYLLRRLKVLDLSPKMLEEKKFTLDRGHLDYFKGLADAGVLWAPHIVDLLNRGDVEVNFTFVEDSPTRQANNMSCPRCGSKELDVLGPGCLAPGDPHSWHSQQGGRSL